MKPIVIFDSECPLCVRFKQSLLFLDKGKEFDFVALQEDYLFQKYPLLNKSECESEIHVLISENKVIKGSEAVKFIISKYSAVKKFSWLIESDSGQKALNSFYDKVNQLRKNYHKKNCPKCNKHTRK